jgi:hypothetical protein
MKLLISYPNSLGYEGCASVDIEQARRSIHVYFKDKDFHLDFVPCIAPNGFEEILYVPDRGFNQWIRSHPIGYINLLNELMKTFDKKVIHWENLLKTFRDHK